MATEEADLGIEFDAARLEDITAEHEEELEGLHPDSRRTRFSDLDGNYRKAEVRANWGEEDKLARQLAAVADWPAREVRKFREELQAIENDDRYSEEFKEERKQELADAYLSANGGGAERGGRLVRAEYETNRLRKRVETETEDFTAFDPPEQETGAYSAQREREIRERVAEADSPFSKATELVRSGDPEAVRAVLNPPAGTSPLSEGNRRRLEKMALKDRYGDAPEQVQALRGLSDLALHNVEEARREIARLGGLGA